MKTEDNYDNTEIQVITLIDDNQKFHGTVIPPKGMTVDEAKSLVLKCIKQTREPEKFTWLNSASWGKVHELLSTHGFQRVGQTFVYELENNNWAVMAHKDRKLKLTDARLYAVVETEEEADIICDDLKKQEWGTVYKQQTNLMVNHVAKGSLHGE